MFLSNFSEMFANLARARQENSDHQDQHSSFSVLQMLGGVRGIAESLLPPLLYILIFSFSQDLLLACGVSMAVALLILCVRLLTKQSLTPAVSGIFGFGISVTISLFTGRAVDAFVVGIFWNLILAIVFLVSVLLRAPLFGFALSFFRGDLKWRQSPQKLRIYSIITIVFFLLSLLRFAVQFPLYLSENFELLGLAKIVMGYPLLGLAVVVSWILFRKIYRHNQ